jgi:hypothetical protein
MLIFSAAPMTELSSAPPQPGRARPSRHLPCIKKDRVLHARIPMAGASSARGAAAGRERHARGPLLLLLVVLAASSVNAHGLPKGTPSGAAPRASHSPHSRHCPPPPMVVAFSISCPPPAAPALLRTLSTTRPRGTSRVSISERMRSPSSIRVAACPVSGAAYARHFSVCVPHWPSYLGADRSPPCRNGQPLQRTISARKLLIGIVTPDTRMVLPCVAKCVWS